MLLGAAMTEQSATVGLEQIREHPYVVEAIRRLEQAIRETDPLSLAQNAGTAVVKREWFDEIFWSHLPLHAEINDSPSGRQLKSEPENKGHKSLRGFDEQGRIRLQRSWSADDPEFGRSSIYYLYDGTTVRDYVVKERPADRPTSRDLRVVGEFAWVSENLRIHVAFPKAHPWHLTAYEYDKGQVRRVIKQRRDPLWKSIISEVSYDEKGNLSQITECGQVIYAPPKRKPQAILREMKPLLLAEIPGTVQALELPHRIYALALIATEGLPNECLPPGLWVGIEPTRVHASRSHNVTKYAGIWDPTQSEEFGEQPDYLNYRQSPESERLLELGRESEIALQQDPDGKTAPFLISIAKELNKLDWGSRVSVTDDFVVYVFDPGESWDTHFAKSVPKSRIKQLVARGFLPPGFGAL
jgi:hypothetical protein